MSCVFSCICVPLLRLGLATRPPHAGAFGFCLGLMIMGRSCLAVWLYWCVLGVASCRLLWCCSLYGINCLCARDSPREALFRHRYSELAPGIFSAAAGHLHLYSYSGCCWAPVGCLLALSCSSSGSRLAWSFARVCIYALDTALVTKWSKPVCNEASRPCTVFILFVRTECSCCVSSPAGRHTWIVQAGNKL